MNRPLIPAPNQKKRQVGLHFHLFIALAAATLLCSTMQAQTLRGRVTDAKGEGIAYASIAIQGTTSGVVAGTDGSYMLSLPSAGSYTLQIRCIGYKPHLQEVTVSAGSAVQNFTLAEEELFVADVMITGDGRDPAYTIMERAIRNRLKNDNSVRAYSAKAYSKAMGIDRKKKKVEFLAESFSTVWARKQAGKPEQRKEIIHNSRISGYSKQYSVVGAGFFTINPYQNLIGFGEVFVREFVSPVAENAFFFYDYKYLGNARENGLNVYKIELKPKRASDPVFNGVIYIADGTYAVKGLEWLLLGKQPIRFLDSLQFKQNYTLLRDSLWVPVSNYVWGSAKINVLVQKFDIEGSLLNVYSEYDVTDPAPPKGSPRPRVAYNAPPPAAESIPYGKQPKKVTDKAQRKLPEVKVPTDSAPKKEVDKFFLEALKIDKYATGQNKNTAFWDSIRPTPLAPRELADFKKGDSTEARKQSKAYVDSVNRKINRPKPAALFTGYTFTNTKNDNTFFIASPIQAIQFNTIEGFNATIDWRKRWNLADERFFILEGKARYAFSEQRFRGQLGFRFLMNQLRRERLQFYAQDFVSEFSTNGLPAIGELTSAQMQMDPLHNTLYSLFGKQNYLKLFQQTGGYARYYRRIYRDNYIDVFGEYYRRSALTNTSNYVFLRNDNRVYEPNLLLPTHFAGRVGLRFHIKFAGRYTVTPNGVFYGSNTKWPQFIVEYAYGIQQNDSLKTGYHQLRMNVRGGFDLKLLGEISYAVRGAVIYSNAELLLPDRLQPLGNLTIFRQNDLFRFGVLDYYTYATSDRYAEQHLEWNLRGFLWNKLPLLRKLKLHEIAGVHSVQMPGLPAHTELLLGITNIRVARLSLFRVNYHRVLTGLNPGREAVTINFGLNL